MSYCQAIFTSFLLLLAAEMRHYSGPVILPKTAQRSFLIENYEEFSIAVRESPERASKSYLPRLVGLAATRSSR